MGFGWEGLAPWDNCAPCACEAITWVEVADAAIPVVSRMVAGLAAFDCHSSAAPECSFSATAARLVLGIQARSTSFVLQIVPIVSAN